MMNVTFKLADGTILNCHINVKTEKEARDYFNTELRINASVEIVDIRYA